MGIKLLWAPLSTSLHGNVAVLLGLLSPKVLLVTLFSCCVCLEPARRLRGEGLSLYVKKSWDMHWAFFSPVAAGDLRAELRRGHLNGCAALGGIAASQQVPRKGPPAWVVVA